MIIRQNQQNEQEIKSIDGDSDASNAALHFATVLDSDGNEINQ